MGGRGSGRRTEEERWVSEPDVVSVLDAGGEDGGMDLGYLERALVGVEGGLTPRERSLARFLSYDVMSDSDLAKAFGVQTSTLRGWKANPQLLEHADKLRLHRRLKMFSRQLRADKMLDKSLDLHEQLLDKAMLPPGAKDPSNRRKKLPQMRDGDKIRLMQVAYDRHQSAQFVKKTRLDIQQTSGVFDGQALVELKKTAAMLEGPTESAQTPVVETSVEEDAALLGAVSVQAQQNERENRDETREDSHTE